MGNVRKPSSMLVASLAMLYGGSILGGLPSVDASCFITGEPKPPDPERERKHNAERLAKAQAKRERKAAKKKGIQ